jgi:hypothetical protein
LAKKKKKKKRYKDITKELWSQKYPKGYEFYKWLMESNKQVKL